MPQATALKDTSRERERSVSTPPASVQDLPVTSPTPSPATALAPEQLKKAVQLEADRRGIIKDFVRSQLETDKDYGRIDIRTRTGITQTKPVLFKSGMEKIFSLFNVVSTLEKDGETIEMVGKSGVIAYKCTLTRGGEFIGEGRGAAEVSEKGRINDAIKIAEKRARMDACLNLGFSEYFTQDLEDVSDLEEPIQSTKSGETSSTGTPRADAWKSGEVRDVTLTVKDKEMKSAQNGTVYALLYTDLGVIKAWKNTYNRFEIGHTYSASIEASEWNGVLSLAVVRLLDEVTV